MKKLYKVELKYTTIYGELVRTLGSQVYLKESNGEIAKFHEDQLQQLTAFELVSNLLSNYTMVDVPCECSGEITTVYGGYNYNVLVSIDETENIYSLSTVHHERNSKDKEGGYANEKRYKTINGLVKNVIKWLDK